MAENALGLIVFGGLAIFSFYLLGKIIKWMGEEDDKVKADSSHKHGASDDDGMVGFGLIATFVLGVVFTVIAYYDLKELLQLIIAPKVYLLEYAADLVKNARQ